jgi:GNAT superfamily N-acetyltransferase
VTAMDIIIRDAEISDCEEIVDILRGLNWFEQINAEPEEITLNRVTRHLAACLGNKNTSVFVAEDFEGRVVGYISVHWQPYLFLKGPEGFISELFVREEARGRGVGSLLLEVVVKEGRERGCARLMLINMRKRESYHREFYKKQGWVEREGAANFVYELMPAE